MEQRQDLGQPSNRKDGTPIWTGRSDEDKTIHARYARREIRVNNEPAFPAMHFDLAENEHGMTLRDYFAAKAMQVMCDDKFTEDQIAEASYRMASAMMKARQS